jgi:hypothetical protein
LIRSYNLGAITVRIRVCCCPKKTDFRRWANSISISGFWGFFVGN